ncbi:uncharacterized protein LOC112603490 [Melanaphis sacchari]|uniref:uncharacterized protein LOC112603490 n=1 Tax=Melanaphis sacchari TaxID=742174 RepID=UPI000DC14528|nr:uncharacterized protein LOC112603490 [Melanaphis sacchari]
MLFGNTCPPFGIDVNFEIATIQSTTKMFGCANLQRNMNISCSPIFNLWLERPMKTIAHSHCKDVKNMDHFVFECLSKREPTKKEEIAKGWHYITLMEHANPNTTNQDINQMVYRCAVYDVNDAPAEGVKIIRMAISAPNIGQLHQRQCESLSKTMGKDDLPHIPEGRRTWPDRSMYLYMLGKPPLIGPPRKYGDIVKYPTSRPMKTTTTIPITTTEIITTTRSNSFIQYQTRRYPPIFTPYIRTTPKSTFFDYLAMLTAHRHNP